MESFELSFFGERRWRMVENRFLHDGRLIAI